MDASLPPATDAGADALWEQQWVDHHYRRALRIVHDTFEPRSVAIFERILAGDAVEVVAAAFELSAQAVHKVKQRIRDRLAELVAEQIREEDQPDAARIEHLG